MSTGIMATVLAMLLTGCATTYVPLSWHYREKTRQLVQSDPTLQVLYGHCDPGLKTLNFQGDSFDQVMMPSEVKYHLGAYRRDTALIYRNLEYKPTEQELRDLLVHEVSHHCWFTTLTPAQRGGWVDHLGTHPSPVQMMVRKAYADPEEYDTEDFAFSVEYARPIDIIALVQLKVITEDEGATLLKLPQRQMPPSKAKKSPSPVSALIEPREVEP